MITKSMITGKELLTEEKELLSDDYVPMKGDPLKEHLTNEADVIVTAVVVGFICTRFYQGQICRFDFESPSAQERAKFLKRHEYKNRDGEILERQEEKDLLKKYHEFLTLMDALSWVVEKQEPGLGKWLLDGQSPEGSEGKVITGKKGGEMTDPEKRVTPMTYAKLRMLDNAIKKKNSIYRGRGAYTGLVENPIEPNDNLYPTFRVQRPEGSWEGIAGEEAWGLIRPEGNEKINLSEDLEEGMGPLGDVDADKVQVGYVHGMCSAIVECEASGIWSTPHEMATGDKTTKMASCFPCATYMYSTGYPPSSIHLGRGESWVPPLNAERLEIDRNNNPKKTGCDELVSQELADKWSRDIYYQMKLGSECLSKGTGFVSERHHEPLSELRSRLNGTLSGRIEESGEGTKTEEGGKDQKVGESDADTGAPTREVAHQIGRLFLDALTLHDKETKRIRRTLQPAYDAALFERNILLGES